MSAHHGVWVYLQSEFGEHHLWTVGFYSPLGKWIAESDHVSAEDAARRVHYLNGGGRVLGMMLPQEPR